MSAALKHSLACSTASSASFFSIPAIGGSTGVEVYVVVDGDLAGRIILGDTQRVASILGLDAFYAELRPEDKVRIVEELQAQGYVVAMVGDGIKPA